MRISETGGAHALFCRCGLATEKMRIFGWERCAFVRSKDAHLPKTRCASFKRDAVGFFKQLVISADENPITLAGKPSAWGNQSFWNLEAGTNSALLMLSLNEVEKRQFTFSFLMSEAVTSSGFSTPSLDAETENDAQSPIFTE